MGAFTVVYLLVFALTLKVFAQETYRTLKSVAGQTAVEVFSQPHRDSNANWLTTIIALFILALALHLLRLYISLEMSDTDEHFYHEFLSSLTWWQKPIEFLLRLLIIAFVSLKAIETFDVLKINTMRDLALFLIILYSILFAWDIFMSLVHWRIAYQYLLPSLTGFIGGFVLMLFARDSNVEANNIIPEMFVLVIFSVLLLVFVSLDLIRNGGHYYKHFSGKLAWICGSRNCQVHQLPPPPPPPGLANTSGIIP
jgi:hypothetical protein